jgi:predicted glycosyltransferase involved in capsule biosynthesis
MGKKGLISVIIPLYGDFDQSKLEFSVESIKRQKGANLEIIVAEQTTIQRLKKITDITYLHHPIELSRDGYFIPGKVRNCAAKMAKGEFIYNTDSDVIFFNDRYFEEVILRLKENQNLCLSQPPMRRLPIENFKEFRERFEEKGLQYALSTLDISQPYGATYNTLPIRIRHFIKQKDDKIEILVATQKDHNTYLDGNNKGKEPCYYSLDVHAGGIIMRKSQFVTIGGYSERYSGWGCHDDDIQWKLGCTFTLETIPKETKYEVLHIDHNRNYFSHKRWMLNEAIKKSRQQKGIASAIDYDMKRYYENK